MKILILNQTNIDLTPDLQKSKDFFTPYLEMDYTVQNITSVPTTLTYYKTVQGFDKNTGQPATIKYLGLSADSRNYLKSIIPEGYDQIVFVYNQDSLSIPSDSVVTSYTESLPILPNTEYVQLAINQYFKDQDKIWKALTHENLHGLCFRANRDGVRVVDEMDNTIVNGQVIPFFQNDLPNAPDGNYAHTLKNLKPFFDSLKPQAQVTITRIISNEATYGNVTATKNGQIFNCHSLELAWKNNQTNISCIPTGTYPCKFTRSLKFPFGTYEVLNVPNRSGIRIHSGNYALGIKIDIAGCLLFGQYFADINKDSKIDLVNSSATVKAFENFMKKEPFTLVIK